MFLFHEYDSAQRKQKSNSKMLYTAYLETVHAYHLQYRYKIFWQKHRDGYELLAKEHLKTKKREYIGRRSKETEEIAESFRKNKQEVKGRLKNLKERLQKDAKLNKLENIARVPKELVAILRKINELDLDRKLIVIGTNSLYAYEAKAGVMLEEDALATRDIDLLNRNNRKLSFMFNLVEDSRLAIDLLKAIDKTFDQSPQAPYRFINKDGIWVELIIPFHKAKKSRFLPDVVALDMEGLQWLENTRLFTETVIGLDGKAANLTTIHPLEYAIYKSWLSGEASRDLLKQTRDREQSLLVTQLMRQYMPNIDIEADVSDLRHIPQKVVKSYLETIRQL